MEVCVARMGFRVRMHDFGGLHAFVGVGSCGFAALTVIPTMTNPVMWQKASIRFLREDRASDVGPIMTADSRSPGMRELQGEGNSAVTSQLTLMIRSVTPIGLKLDGG